MVAVVQTTFCDIIHHHYHCLWAGATLLYPCSILMFLGHTWVPHCPPSRCLDGWYSLWGSGPALRRFLLTVFKKPRFLPPLGQGFMMEPQCNLLMFLSLLLPVLPEEHPWPPVMSNILPCLCDPTWSFLAHCNLEDGEEAGWRNTQSLHVTSLWVRNLLHHVGSQLCSLTLWSSVYSSEYCGTLVPPLLQPGKLCCLLLLSRRKCFLRHDSKTKLKQTQKDRYWDIQIQKEYRNNK